MEYNFKKFEGRNQKTEDRITVTRKSNSIGFPTRFYEDNKIKEYKYVVLFWDKENKAIGLRFTNDDTEKDKFSILKSKQGYGASLVVRSFFKVNSIDLEEFYGKYDWKKIKLDDGTELFVIELKSRKEAG